MKHNIHWLIDGIYRKIVFWYGFIRVDFFRLIAYLLRSRFNSKHYWVLHERGDDAQDNAWHLLRYIRREHPEQNVVYAIRKSSKDYISNLADYQDVVVEYDSFRYYMILFNADAVVTTHYQTTLWPHNLLMTQKSKNRLKINAKRVFLQHGVTRHRINALSYPNLGADIFVCGAKIEYELMTSEGMNYSPSIAKYTGFARFDNLWNNDEKNQILVMPTWRMMYSTMTNDEFAQTDFFRFYHDVLTDDRLLDALKRHKFTVAYYNHYEFQKFNACFQTIESENVQLVKFGSIRVQELLKQSKILMTDFSSIYYDFLYMGKPVVFAALDEKAFSATQYGKRYDGSLSDFGYTTKDVDDAVTTFIRLLDTGCQLEDKFKQQQSRVFPMRDQHNCERIYTVIKEIV